MRRAASGDSEASGDSPASGDSEAGGVASGSEKLSDEDAGDGRATWRAAGCAAAAALLLAGAGAGAARLALRGAASDVGGPQRRSLLPNKVETVALPPRHRCASSGDDCYSLGCCNVAGVSCLETEPGKGQCLTELVMDSILGDAGWYGPSLYCFAVVMQDIDGDGDSDGPKKHFDLEQLRGAYDKGAGIFGCETWAVFSDMEGEVGPGAPLVKLENSDGDFHFAKNAGGDRHMADTGMHYQAWKAIGEAGVYKNASWIVKVDADAVFVPSRLVSYLSSKVVPANGMYLESCKNVRFGWSSSLEIFSAAAFETLLGSMASCRGTIDWKTGVHGGRYGPMGEDQFAQFCLDANGVSRGEAFGTKLDGTCDADRPAGHVAGVWLAVLTCLPVLAPGGILLLVLISCPLARAAGQWVQQAVQRRWAREPAQCCYL